MSLYLGINYLEADISWCMISRLSVLLRGVSLRRVFNSAGEFFKYET